MTVKFREGDWAVHAFCKCGWHREAFCADLWFVRQSHPVCPKCGASAWDYTLKKIRILYTIIIANRWWKLNDTIETEEVKDYP